MGLPGLSLHIVGKGLRTDVTPKYLGPCEVRRVVSFCRDCEQSSNLTPPLCRSRKSRNTSLRTKRARCPSLYDLSLPSFLAHEVRNLKAPLLKMNKIRAIQELNKKEIEQGMYVATPVSFCPTKPEADLFAFPQFAAPRMPPGIATTATPPSSTSAASPTS